MSSITQESNSKTINNSEKLNKIFEKSPFYGFYSLNYNKFIDKDIVEPKYQNHIRLVKVKIWYGTVSPKIESEKIYGKQILGIQCEYHNSINGNRIKTELHCGSLNSNDIIIKELDLSQEFISKFYICYNDIILYIKFITNKGNILEVGNYNKDCEKTIPFNIEKDMNMIHSFYGYYNEYGLRALGCIHLKRKNYFFYKLFDVFRFRNFLKHKNEEREKWTEDKIKQLEYQNEAFIRLCLLPDSQFYCIIQFCI